MTDQEKAKREIMKQLHGLSTYQQVIAGRVYDAAYENGKADGACGALMIGKSTRRNNAVFITKKALQRRIEEGIAKERERMEMQKWIDDRIRDNSEEIKWIRQAIDKRLWEMECRICKLEGKNLNEVKSHEST